MVKRVRGFVGELFTPFQPFYPLNRSLLPILSFRVFANKKYLAVPQHIGYMIYIAYIDVFELTGRMDFSRWIYYWPVLYDLFSDDCIHAGAWLN